MTDGEWPPDGGKASKPMWEALNAELRREVEGGDGDRSALLRVIVRKLAAKAADGDISAIKEIFDRMDGKSVAGAAPDEEPRKVIFEWNDEPSLSATDPAASSSPSTAGGSASPAS
jgi:hypothetical protein